MAFTITASIGGTGTDGIEANGKPLACVGDPVTVIIDNAEDALQELVPGIIDNYVNDEYIISNLQNKIRASELYKDLNSRIDLIDGAYTLPGSVAERVYQESQARTAAILEEAAAREEAITSESILRNEADLSLASQIELVTAGIIDGNESLAAAIQQETTARVEGDMAEALSREILAVEVKDLNSGLQLAYSAITDESIVRATADEAEAIMREQMVSRIDNDISVAMAAIENEAATRATADEAEAIQRQLLDASFSEGLAFNAAAIENESIVRATADSAEAIQRETLAAKVTEAESDIIVTAAAIENEALVRATETSALASTTEILQTNIAENYAAIQIQASVSDGLKAQYTIKIDNNGFMSGFGLASCASTASAFSELYMMADQFAVINPNTSGFVINSIVSSGLTATVTTVNSNTVSALDYVVITGAYPYGYNGSFKATPVDSNTFTITLSSSLASPAQVAEGFENIKYGIAAIPFIVEDGKVYLENAYIGNTISASSTMSGSGLPTWMILRDGAIYARKIVIGQDWENYFLKSDESGTAIDHVDIGSSTTISGIPATTVADTVYNFNSSNDRKTTQPATPTFSTTLSDILDYVNNTDGSVDVTFEWNYVPFSESVGDEYDIDGFIVHCYSHGTVSPTISACLTILDSIQYFTEPLSRVAIFPAIAANNYYTFGVQAYRSIDSSLNPTGLTLSNIATPTTATVGEFIAGAWRPTDSVAFSGNVIGTVNNVSASTLTIQASLAYTGTSQYRIDQAPSTNGAFGSITQGYTSSGEVVFTVPYTYTQGAIPADQLFIYAREELNNSSFNITAGDWCVGTTAKSGVLSFGVTPSDSSGTRYIKFGIQATRRTETGLRATSILQSSAYQVNEIGVLSTNNPLSSGNIAGYVGTEAISDSYIASLDVGKLTGIAVRGKGVIGKTVAVKGAIITGLDSTNHIIYVDSTEDFPDRGIACIPGSPSAPAYYNYMWSYTAKTATSFTGVSFFPWTGVVGVGYTLVPFRPNVMLSSDYQELRTFGYLTSDESTLDDINKINQICSIGHMKASGDNAIIYSGSPNYSRGSTAAFVNKSISGAYNTAWMKNYGEGTVLSVENASNTSHPYRALNVYTKTSIAGYFQNDNFDYSTFAVVQSSSTTAALGVAAVVSNKNSTTFGYRGIYSEAREAIVGYGLTRDFYAVGPGTNYASFTGAHDSLLHNSINAVIGDIMIDENVKYKMNVSNAVTSILLTDKIKDKRVIGVFVSKECITLNDIESIDTFEEMMKLLAYSNIPNAVYCYINDNITAYNWESFKQEFLNVLNNYKWAMVNSLGEGQINVCAEGGNIEVGDYICSSSIPGKGMKQPDDLLYNYTVAKSRENVAWTQEEIENNIIKTIACTYHCG